MPAIATQPQRYETESKPGRLLSAAERFISFWSVPILHSVWARAALAIIVACLCLMRAKVAVIGSSVFTHDAFMLFDGAWRMLNGQRPHIDFYSHLGFLTYYPTLVGFWLSHGTAYGLGYGQALVGVFAGIWSYLLCRKRLSDVGVTFFCLCVVLLTTASFALGFEPLSVSPAMTYNRYGYAFLSLILVEALLKSKAPGPSGELSGGLSTGAVVSLLLFLKVTYFAAALFLLFVMLPCRRQTKQRWLGIALGFFAVSILMASYFHFDLLPMFKDLRTVAGAKMIRLRWYMVDSILENAALVMAFAGTAALWLLTQGNKHSARAIVIAAAGISVVGALLILGNYEQNGFPLAAFIGIVTLELLAAHKPVPNESSTFFKTSVVLFGLVFVLAAIASGAMGLTYGMIVQKLRTPYLARLDSPVLEGFRPMYEEEYYAKVYNEGLSMIRKYMHPGDTIMSLDFCNPFSYALGLKPAPGGATVLQYKTTFNDSHRPSAEQLFGAADMVIVPRTIFPDIPDILRLYGPYLKSHFHSLDEAKDWQLYRRND